MAHYRLGGKEGEYPFKNSFEAESDKQALDEMRRRLENAAMQGVILTVCRLERVDPGERITVISE